MPEIKWNAKAYDEKHSFVSRFGSDLVGWLDPQPGETILDLGCGTGQLAAEIAESGADVIAVDSSLTMIEKARKNYPTMEFMMEDARHLNFHERFDAIFSNATLHWIQEQDKVADGVFKSLKTGGRFVFELGGKNNVECICRAIVHAFRKQGIIKNLSDTFWYFPSVAEYAAILENAGLTVTHLLYFKRETALVGEDGMKNWILMFGDFFFEGIHQEQKQAILDDAVEILRPERYRDGIWYADYMRLRGSAEKN
jgi:trans-aconitate methyltransferase